MCALLIMACYDTEENGRSEYTLRTLHSLTQTVDWNKHRLIVVDNNSCQATKKIINSYLIDMIPVVFSEKYEFVKPTIITLSENVGTARGINFGLQQRLPGESAIKIDNDVVIHQSGWVDEMGEVIRRDTNIGIVGLKRKDLCQTPWHENPDFRSELMMLPHEPGEKWIIVEKSRDIMGTCTMLSPALLDKIGYYISPGIYGLDDTLINLRSLLAGFINVFLPHIDISHIDNGGTAYVQEKHRLAGEAWPIYHQMHKDYCSGAKPLYYDGGFTK